MRSIFIYSPLKPLKRFISKSLSSTESSLEQAAYTTPHSNMCSGSWSSSSSSSSKKHPSLVVVNLKRQQQKTKTHVSVAIRRKRLKLRRLRAGGAEAMEMVNLKLYLENRCIIAENERLRERASALRRENLALRQNLSNTTAAQAEVATAGAGAA